MVTFSNNVREDIALASGFTKAQLVEAINVAYNPGVNSDTGAAFQ